MTILSFDRDMFTAQEAKQTQKLRYVARAHIWSHATFVPEGSIGTSLGWGGSPPPVTHRFKLFDRATPREVHIHWVTPEGEKLQGKYTKSELRRFAKARQPTQAELAAEKRVSQQLNRLLNKEMKKARRNVQIAERRKAKHWKEERLKAKMNEVQEGRPRGLEKD